MSSILDLTVKDLLAQVHQGNGFSGKFDVRNDAGELMMVVAIAWQHDAAPLSEAVDAFLSRDGRDIASSGDIPVDKAKADTERLLPQPPRRRAN